MFYSGMRLVDKLHADYNPSYSGMRFIDKIHADYNPSYSGMRFVNKLHTDYNPCLTLVWGLLTSYMQITIHILLRYEVCWQDTHRLQSMSYSGMRFVNKLHTDYNPYLTPVLSSLKSYTQTTIHVLLRYEVCWQVAHRRQSISYFGMKFVDKLHTDYNPCLTLVWGLLTSYRQNTIHVLFRYEVCWQVTRRLQSMSYSRMRFVDKLHADYYPCLTPVWVCWQVTRRLQSMSYSGKRFVDKIHADYNPCLTLVWGFWTSYTQTTIHVLLRYEVCWQVTRRLQSMSYSGMRFIDKIHLDYNPCLTLVWGLLTSYMQTTIHLTLVWGLLTSYTQITIHVLLRYEVCWQVTRRLQSMSYSGMRFVDKLHADYNPCLTLVWGLLTSSDYNPSYSYEVYKLHAD